MWQLNPTTIKMGARDVRLQHPSSLIVSGLSNSGKMLKCWFRMHWFTDFKKNIENIVFIIMLATVVWWFDKSKKCEFCWRFAIVFIAIVMIHVLPFIKNNLLIIDNLMNDASNNVDVQNVFTKYVHHRNLSCLYLVQNQFFQGKVTTINLNTYVLFCFKTPGTNTKSC